MRLCKNLAPPVKTVDEIVLITHVPYIFPDPAAQFNARKKNGCDQKPNQDAPNEIPGGSRHYLEMQESSNTHSPQKKKTEILFDRLHQFSFETLPYLIVREISTSRMTPQIPRRIN